MNKLRVITRADLAPGAQAAQLVHGALQWAADHPDLVRAWMAESNTVVLLAVRDEAALRALLRQAEERGVVASVFVEPDLGGALTCIALGPGEAAQRLCARLPLALRPATTARSAVAA